MTESSPTLYAALAKAQGEFKTVLKNKTNPHLKNSYADLQSILDAVRPALNANGLFVMQRVTTVEGGVSIETVLTHSSGETISSGQLIVSGNSSGNKAISGIQALGSAITYARRYSMCAFLGITAEDDDDGNGAAEAQSREKQQAFVLTEAMVATARAHAANGTEDYKAFYQSQPEGFRKAMSETGWHKACWIEAKKADTEDQQ